VFDMICQVSNSITYLNWRQSWSSGSAVCEIIWLSVCCCIVLVSRTHKTHMWSDLAGVQGNEITDDLVRNGSALKFVGPEPALGVSRRVIRRRIRRWLVNQHWLWWRGLGDTQRQAREL